MSKKEKPAAPVSGANKPAATGSNKENRILKVVVLNDPYFPL